MVFVANPPWALALRTELNFGCKYAELASPPERACSGDLAFVEPDSDPASRVTALASIAGLAAQVQNLIQQSPELLEAVDEW
jgi:hypothetical protein